MIIEAICVSEEEFDFAWWKGAHHHTVKDVHMQLRKFQDCETNIEGLVDSELRLWHSTAAKFSPKMRASMNWGLFTNF